MEPDVKKAFQSLDVGVDETKKKVDDVKKTVDDIKAALATLCKDTAAIAKETSGAVNKDDLAKAVKEAVKEIDLDIKNCEQAILHQLITAKMELLKANED